LGDRTQSVTVNPHRDRAVLISPEQGHSSRPDELHRTRRRMTIIVVGPSTRDGEASLGRGEEPRILPSRSVVGNLEDISSKVGPGAQDRLLTWWFDIAGEQQP
jgi:hypothetical protein